MDQFESPPSSPEHPCEQTRFFSPHWQNQLQREYPPKTTQRGCAAHLYGDTQFTMRGISVPSHLLYGKPYIQEATLHRQHPPPPPKKKKKKKTHTLPTVTTLFSLSSFRSPNLAPFHMLPSSLSLSHSLSLSLSHSLFFSSRPSFPYLQ